MELAIFAKKRTGNDGRTFYSYLSTLKKKDGTEQTVSVKFREECGKPKPENCPMYINVDKGNANISRKQFIREDTGEAAESVNLWVSAWEQGKPYVDTSLDEYED